MTDVMRLDLKIDDKDKGKRLDAYLARQKEIPSRSFAQHLIEKGLVRVNDEKVTKNHRLKEGESVSLEIPPPELSPSPPGRLCRRL